MNTTFDDIIIGVLEREGGFVDHPDDRGGATKFGVTIGTLRRHNIDVDGDGDIDSQDVKELPLETAKRLYGEQYWQPSRAGDLPSLFDMCINHGVRNAVSILQHAANHDPGILSSPPGRPGTPACPVLLPDRRERSFAGGVPGGMDQPVL